MVLAAGLGRRLRPLTVRWAKPAVPVLGRPLLAYLLEQLAEAGATEIVVNLHHNAASVEGVLDAFAPAGVVIHRSPEPEILGTGGGLKKAERWLRDGPFVVLNGDTWMEVALDVLVAAHRRRRPAALATMLLRPRPGTSEYTAFGLDAEGRIVSVGGETPGADAMFAGAWVLEPAVLDRLPEGGYAALEKDLLPDLVAEGRCFGVLSEDAWFDVGTPRRYLRASLAILRDGVREARWGVRRLAPPPGSTEATRAGGVGTTLHPDAVVRDEVVLGARCRVEAGAVLQRAVLWDDVTVGRGAVVRHSIVTDGVVLPEGSATEGKIVMRLGAADASEAFRARERLEDRIVATIRR